MRYEQVGEHVFSVERNYHCLLVNLQNFAVRHCGRRPHAQRLSSQATFAEKLPLAQYAQGCFLANLRYDTEANLTCLDVEDRISRISLRKDYFFLGKSHYFPTHADSGKEFLRVEVGPFLGGHDWCHQWLLSNLELHS